MVIAGAALLMLSVRIRKCINTAPAIKAAMRMAADFTGSGSQIPATSVIARLTLARPTTGTDQFGKP